MATSARTKTSNKPSLKSQGAGYSTTNRKGETTYYKSSKDAPGYTSASSKGNAPISKVDASGATIPVSTMQTNETPAPVPPVPNVPNIGDITGANNAGLAGVVGEGTTYDPTKGFQTQAQEKDVFTSLYEQAQEANASAFEEIGTGESRLKKLEKETQLRQKQQAVNQTTSQINAIVAKQQADLLRVEGQGRGIPEPIIGGQQAQINKEAAIAALPLQAKLAGEQGALELAQDYVTKMYEIQSNDALMKYNYKSKVIDSVYNFATASEQRRLDAIKDKENKAFELQKGDIAFQRDLASQAIEYGQSGVAASIMKLNPTSPTFRTDLANAQARLSKPTTVKGPDIQNFGTSDNPKWGYVDANNQFVPISGINSDDPVTAPVALAQSQAAITDVDALLQNKGGLSSAVGTNFLSRSTTGFWANVGKVASLVGLAPFAKQTVSRMTGKEQAFISGVEQMRQQLTLDNLIRAKQNGATFGALSDGERQMLASSATKIGTWAVKDDKDNVIGYNIDEKTLKKEITQINNFAKLDYINKGGNLEDIGAVQNSDGSIWVKNTDGTFTRLK